MITSKRLGATLLALPIAAILAAMPSQMSIASLPNGAFATLETNPSNASASAGAASADDTGQNALDRLGGIFQLIPAGPSAPAMRPMPAVPEDVLASLPLLASPPSPAKEPAAAPDEKEIVAQLQEIVDAEDRKDAFIGLLKPAVRSVNDRIASDRKRLLAIKAEIDSGQGLGGDDEAWLTALADEYKADASNVPDLVKRVDVVPDALAVAQAALESGWGTSKLARNKLAFFGQTAGDGFASFDTVEDGVSAYIMNLNTHRAYEKFRAERAKMRQGGDRPDGYKLANYLQAYSELGTKYVGQVKTVMKANDLQTR